jgi:iron complex outermembrane receptor protein
MRGDKLNMKPWRAALVGAGAFASAASLAEEGPASTDRAANSESLALEQVVVTARRTQENLQTTPVSVTAVGREELQRVQVNNTADLQRLAPNLNIATGSPSVSSYVFISLRGQTQVNPGSASDPAVGIYIDEVYIPRPSQGLFDFADLQRVEVLRGPQGTLFGRNTTGGAINIVTVEPNGNLEGSVRGSYGNYGAVEGGFTANIPILGDELAARTVYSFSKHDGYAYNATIDERTADQAGSHFVRTKLRWAPADSEWRVSLSADYNKQRDHGENVGLTGFNATALAPIVQPLVGTFPALAPLADLTPLLSPYLRTSKNWYTTYGTGGPLAGELPMDTLKAYGASALITGRFAGINFKSVSGYRFSRTDSIIDLDGSPLRLAQNHTGFGSAQWSQEFQLSGAAGPFGWIAGVYYSRERGDEKSLFEALGILGVPPLLNYANVENISVGLYTQGYYKFTDKLRLATGVRWTWDRRDAVLHNLAVYNNVSSCNVPAPDNGTVPPCDQTEKVNFNYPAWVVGLDYQLTDTLFTYAKTSAAAMAGGWNLRFGSIPAFKPETVRDVELGLKSDFIDHRLRANVAVFHSWQGNLQRNVSIQVGPSAVTQYVVNAGSSQISGLELELTALPWKGFEISSSVGLLNGRYDKGRYKETQIVNGMPVIVDRSGEPLPQFAKANANIGVTQTLETFMGSLDLHMDYAYISRQNFNPLTAAPGSSLAARETIQRQNELATIPGYGIVNGRAALLLNGKPSLEVALFVRNLLDRQYATNTFSSLYTSPLATAVDFTGAPRTYGISFNCRFGS